MEWFSKLPAQTLNMVISDPMAARAKITLGSVVLDNLIDRTTHRSPRAKRDVAAAMALLTAYKDAGGGIR